MSRPDPCGVGRPLQTLCAYASILAGSIDKVLRITNINKNPVVWRDEMPSADNSPSRPRDSSPDTVPTEGDLLVTEGNFNLMGDMWMDMGTFTQALVRQFDSEPAAADVARTVASCFGHAVVACEVIEVPQSNEGVEYIPRVQSEDGVVHRVCVDLLGGGAPVALEHTGVGGERVLLSLDTSSILGKASSAPIIDLDEKRT